MPQERPLVLLVDREGAVPRALTAFLREHGWEVAWARDAEGAWSALEERVPDALVSELDAPRIDGLAVLRRALERNPELCAVLVADRVPLALAVEAMREGAWDVQPRPVHADRLLAVLERGRRHRAMASRLEAIEEQLDERFGMDRLIGRSRALQRVVEQLRHVASLRTPVLLEGEAGTGKSVVALAIHQNGPRRRGRFVRASCEGAAEGLLEAELFGVEQGPPEGRRGRIELADGGTLFLDRVEEAPPAVQARLLRVLQDGVLERVGGGEERRVDPRFLAATDRDLAAEVAAGRFRRDLFERLTVVRVAIPPLRERREDIPLLVERFLGELNREHGRRLTGVTPGVLERLMAADWPGNVAELRATLEGMVVAARGRRPLGLEDLPAGLKRAAPAGWPGLTPGMTVAEAERLLIELTLRETGGDKRRAAAMLGIGLRTLYRKLAGYGLH
jgi:DNA-binding NtrC family response regulator